MELIFRRGINGKSDKLSNTVTFFQKNFMVLNCTFDFGFGHADRISFSINENGAELSKIVLKDCFDLYMPESNMININKLIAKQENTLEINLLMDGDIPFDLKLNYI